jgi:LmbE family N-acetylglucosaminyl deacetylase
MKILAIGAHPDDIELGVGGTIAKHVKNNDDVYGLVLSNGESVMSNGGVHDRKEEAKRSAKVLGIKEMFFGNLEDTKIPESSETIKIIESVLEKVKPDRLYTHTVRDPHQDHRSVAKAVVSACREAKVKQILLYISPLRQVDFQPKVFSDITPFMTVKLRALKFFFSQNHKFYMSNEAVRGLAMYWGYFIKSKYAECFEVEKLVEY